MPTTRPSSCEGRSLAASAHELQRAAGNLQKHAAGTDPVPTLGITLAHIEEALDRLSVGMLQMANGVVESCGEQGLPADEDALPPQAFALCFHLRAVADALRAPHDACTSSRIWTRRLLKTRPDTEPAPYLPAPDPDALDAAACSATADAASQTGVGQWRSLRTSNAANDQTAIPPRPMRAEPGPLFASVVCVVDRSSTGHAARHQAATLAAGGDVECISTPRRRSANSALLDRCDGADLLVLAAGDDAVSVLEHTSIPVLLARWCPSGASVTDRILVAVDDESEPHRAAEVAGLLALRYGGTVAVLPAPERNRALERATAASSRIVLQVTGLVPRVVGEQALPARAISSATTTIDASLLVLPLGNTESARNRAALIARHVGCSVLAVPVRAAFPELLALERPTGVRRLRVDSRH